jgi:hypothetical protein
MDSLRLRVDQMPKSRDLVIFVVTDGRTNKQMDRTDYFTPCCARVRGVMRRLSLETNEALVTIVQNPRHKFTEQYCMSMHAVIPQVAHKGQLTQSKSTLDITAPSRKRAHFEIPAHPPLLAQFPAKL